MKRVVIAAAIVALTFALPLAPVLHAAIAVVVTDSTGAGAGDNDFATSASVDTTGANLLVVVASWYTGTTSSVTVTDSKSNSWNQRTQYEANNYAVQIWYSVPSSVGSGHTFTVTGVDTFPVVSVVAVSGAHATPYDTENGATATGTTIPPGSITQNQNDSLVITGVMFNLTDFPTATINESYTADVTEAVGGQNVAGGIAYMIQTTATATNPTWTLPSGDNSSAAIASFKVAAAGVTCNGGLLLLGVGRC